MSSYRIVHGETHNLPDVAAFIEILNSLEQDSNPTQSQVFDPAGELYVARAPGRLDVMGGIADYSGSLVLELPIQEATFVALQRDPERRLRVVSLFEGAMSDLTFAMLLSEFEGANGPIEYETARTLFESDPSHHWAAYVAGVFLVLERERGVRFSEGARILISSNVPSGKGVSSSAALEVAVMQAVSAAFDIHIEGREIAMLCQMVENLVVGAPCGVMDQTTSTCGQDNRLLAILCQPAEILGVIAIPGEIGFWGLDSGIRHSVSGSDYGSVRAGAFMGQRIIASMAGLNVMELKPGTCVHMDDSRWGGYLSNISPSEFEQYYAAHLPERIRGADFLERYQGTTDPLTRIDPEVNYVVRVPAAHAIYEHHRVGLFAELLNGPPSERKLRLLGELMYQSHSSYSACGLGSSGTDRLVDLVREAGFAQGLYGAKITGGGSGGTVAILGNRNAGKAIESLAKQYAEATDYHPYIFAGSSPGSAAFGHLKLSRT